jgi:hypothetical protein
VPPSPMYKLYSMFSSMSQVHFTCPPETTLPSKPTWSHSSPLSSFFCILFVLGLVVNKIQEELMEERKCQTGSAKPFLVGTRGTFAEPKSVGPGPLVFFCRIVAWVSLFSIFLTVSDLLSPRILIPPIQMGVPRSSLQPEWGLYAIIRTTPWDDNTQFYESITTWGENKKPFPHNNIISRRHVRHHVRHLHLPSSRNFVMALMCICATTKQSCELGATRWSEKGPK